MKFSLTDYREVRKFFIIFYVVGTIGMVLPLTQALFIRLIPYSLLLNLAYLGYFHADKKSLKTVLAFIGIAVLSFFIEMICVESGLIFGTYAYGEGLGLKWHDTPLIIGVNWVILVYCSSAILEQYTHWKSVVKILAASALMLLYDVVLEIAAPKMDMWVFNHEEVPIANYVAWFVIAALFHTVIKLLKIKIKNPLALTIFACQFVFFILLAMLLK